MKPIFISGTHGCGKTTLIKKLLSDEENFILDNYHLDFINDLASYSVMTVYEECLLRLYHRFYTAEQAILKCKENNDKKMLIVDRSIYDSYVYNEVEYKLGTLTQKEYNHLSEVTRNCLKILEPFTVILNPDPKLILDHLNKRQKFGIRIDRDKKCSREDTLQYISMMWTEYLSLYQNKNVLSIDNIEDIGIDKIRNWVTNEVLKEV